MWWTQCHPKWSSAAVRRRIPLSASFGQRVISNGTDCHSAVLDHPRAYSSLERTQPLRSEQKPSEPRIRQACVYGTDKTQDRFGKYSIRTLFLLSTQGSKMDSALLREREAFKKRAMAVPVVENRKRESPPKESKKKPTIPTKSFKPPPPKDPYR